MHQAFWEEGPSGKDALSITLTKKLWKSGSLPAERITSNGCIRFFKKLLPTLNIKSSKGIPTSPWRKREKTGIKNTDWELDFVVRIGKDSKTLERVEMSWISTLPYGRVSKLTHRMNHSTEPLPTIITDIALQR